MLCRPILPMLSAFTEVPCPIEQQMHLYQHWYFCNTDLMAPTERWSNCSTTTNTSLTFQRSTSFLHGPEQTIQQHPTIVHGMRVRLLCPEVVELSSQHFLEDVEFFRVHHEMHHPVHGLGKEDGLLVVVATQLQLPEDREKLINSTHTRTHTRTHAHRVIR